MSTSLSWAAVLIMILGISTGLIIGRIFSILHKAEKKTENSAVELSESLQSCLNQLPIAVLVYDRSLSVRFVNTYAQDNSDQIDAVITNEQAQRILHDVLRKRDTKTLSSTDKTPYWLRAFSLSEDYVFLYLEDETQHYETERIRQEFITNLSHEINTPLASITLLTEAIDAAGESESHSFTVALRKEVDRLAKLVQNIAHLSQAQSQYLSDSDEIVDLRSVINEVVDEHITIANEHGITIAKAQRKDAAFVKGNKRSLHIALANLVGNAIQYSGEGKQIVLGLRSIRGTHELFVTDQGCGIPQEEQKKIFERFYRPDSARSRHTGGTGLGLSIVRHTIESLNGEVKLWSQPGIGSTFTIVLPEYRNRF